MAHDVRYVELVPTDLIKGRIVRNPAYPGVALVNGWVGISEISQRRKPAFRAALAASLAAEGFRNPVVLYQAPGGLYLSFGGSRVQAAKDSGIEFCKAIINDYTGEWADYEEVTEDNWESFFTDVPDYHEFGEHGFDYHYSLERNRRHTHDPKGLAWAEDVFSEFAHEFPWVTNET
jgi:hypothetical protein